MTKTACLRNSVLRRSCVGRLRSSATPQISCMAISSADRYGEHPRARNAHAIRLFDYGAGQAITIAHLHGLRGMAGKGDTPARRGQADALMSLIGQIWRKGERLVVCGDFNVLPGSVMFDVLGGLGLTDLVTSRGFTDTRTSHYAKDGRFADYMLVTPEVGVVSFDVVGEPEVSDHRPLLLDIGLPGRHGCLQSTPRRYSD